MMSRVDLFSSIWCDFQTRGFKDRSALLDWLWETSVPSRFCTICNVYNQEAYAHNISDNWVFTSLLILDSEIKNTHSLTIELRSLLITLHPSTTTDCSLIQAAEKSVTIHTEITFTEGGKRVVLITLRFRALPYGSLLAVAAVVHSVSSRAVCD